MKRTLPKLMLSLGLLFLTQAELSAQITKLQDYSNNHSATIGTYQNITFREAGFSSLYPIPNTNGKEFWTISDRGVNIDCGSANPSTCRPTYDKMFPFPTYAPKIHRIRVNGDSVQILQTITMKRPGGTTATGLMNPDGFGSTATEVISTDTVLNCANFNAKTTAKDIWGIDSEGLVVDKDGNFWISEEGGPTIWKLNRNGVVIKRYTPYATSQTEDVAIDAVFATRKNNRGFEGLAITPSGKIYAIIQSPLLNPNTSTGENTQIHRILEIDPATDATQMYVFLNDGIIGGSGSNQIRLRDWKVGDMAAVNDHEFILILAAIRGTSDKRYIYKIDIAGATPVTSGLYGGVTLEALVDATGLTANGITPVSKTLVMDLLTNGWPVELDKAEGLAIINDSTIAIGNDNDFGQTCPAADGIAIATTNKSHVIVYRLSGANKLTGYVAPTYNTLNFGQTGISSSQSPYVVPVTSAPGIQFTSIITTGDAVGGYTMCGLPDGTGAYDNGDGTFTVLVNHEIGATAGVVRAHGSKGAFVSKWVINKADYSVVSGADLIQTIKLWNTGTNSYDTYTSANPTSATAFGRFCSADLPSVYAYYNPVTGLGTQERIFMNGEETGNEGRAFGHIATGANAGTTYELPRLGKASWENQVASPFPQDKTIVAGFDDSTPGQVYLYVGTKTNTGTEVEKAGLTNGKLYGISVNGMVTESDAVFAAPGTAFTLFDLGNVENVTGATINTNSNNNGVTNFLRPEDGAWDPANPNDLYFVTTNGFNNPSRLWKLHFTDITNPESGGTITAVLDGTEGQKMLDNLAIDNSGHVLLVEDVGNNARLGRTWEYNIATDQLVELASHDDTRFITGAANFLTQDEEASGIIDAQAILGPGMFIVVDQAHYSRPGQLVEGGQMLVFNNPATAAAQPEVNVKGNNVNIVDGNTSTSASDNTDLGSVEEGSDVQQSFVIENTGAGALVITGINIGGTNAADFSLVSAPTFPLTIAAGSSQTITVSFSPTVAGTKNATLYVWNTDENEGPYEFSLQGTATVATGVMYTDDATGINVYPNPAAGKEITVSVVMESTEKVVISVTDVQGNAVLGPLEKTFTEGENEVTLDISSLNSGTYIVQVVSGNKKLGVRTVVIR